MTASTRSLSVGATWDARTRRSHPVLSWYAQARTAARDQQRPDAGLAADHDPRCAADVPDMAKPRRPRPPRLPPAQPGAADRGPDRRRRVSRAAIRSPSRTAARSAAPIRLLGYDFRAINCDRRRKPDPATPALCDRDMAVQVEYHRTLADRPEHAGRAATRSASATPISCCSPMPAVRGWPATARAACRPNRIQALARMALGRRRRASPRDRSASTSPSRWSIRVARPAVTCSSRFGSSRPMRRALYLFAVAGRRRRVHGVRAGARADCGATRRAGFAAQPPGPRQRPARRSGVARRPHNAYKIQVHWRVQLWRSRTLFDRAAAAGRMGRRSIQQVPVLDVYTYTEPCGSTPMTDAVRHARLAQGLGRAGRAAATRRATLAAGTTGTTRGRRHDLDRGAGSQHDHGGGVGDSCDGWSWVADRRQDLLAARGRSVHRHRSDDERSARPDRRQRVCRRRKCGCT